MNPTLGSIPSGEEYRDKLAAAAVLAAVTAEAQTLPASFLTDIAKLGEVLDQNQIPACVSHAWAIVMKYWWYKKTGEVVDFSPRFLDILSAEEWIPLNGGRVPRTVCKISAKFGCCTTKLLPNNTNLPIEQYRNKAVITQEMYDEAAKYKVPGYVRIPDSDALDFRKGVYHFGVISGLFSIGEEFWKPSYDPAQIMPLRTPATIVSGHQMVVRGWDGALNRVRNSWGRIWGYEGDGTYNASVWLPYIFEAWAVAEIPNDLKVWLSSLPSQTDFHYYWDRDLVQGNVSEDVKFAQIAFMILGYMKPVKPEDLGIFGPKTAAANLAFQTAQRIFPTAPGRIGPKTRAALNAKFAL